MKYKDYEKFGLVRLFIVILLVFFVFLLIFSVAWTSIKDCSLLSGVTTSSRQVMIIVSAKQASWFYRNTYVMIDGEKKKFSIDRVNKNILNNNQKNYHQMFLKIDLPKRYRVNDTVMISFHPKSVSLWSIFFKTWKGD